MNRKEVVAWFLDKLEMLDPGNPNVEIYQSLFDKMSNAEFESMVDKMASGELVLAFTQPNLGKYDVKMKNIFRVADKIGLKLMQRLLIKDDVTGVEYLTPHEYLVLDMPVKRQSQHLSKKKSFSDDVKHTDVLTGQTVGTSKTSRMSLPEVMILESLGLTSAIEELSKIRGGDIEAGRKARRLMIDSGSYSLVELSKLGTRPTSVDTMNAYLLGMSLDNNL